MPPRRLGSSILAGRQFYAIARVVNGVQRTFRDQKQPAYGAARLLKEKNSTSIVEMIDRSTGSKVRMNQVTTC